MYEIVILGFIANISNTTYSSLKFVHFDLLNWLCPLSSNFEVP